ncbi:MAG: 2-oxoglutarate ferredoxin oxidoreductase subunit alpha, partial [Acidimicrobiia bacterium]|nr:2-oxoglutarate ferredoxin oxidoreductase subunit alpha [Acidimicrobiia bacterium]
DGYLANGSEPWRLPDVADLPDLSVEFASTPNQTDEDGEAVFWPYLRDENLARPWAIPGTPELMHRIGGIEKAEGSGNISYDPANHQAMTDVREARIAKIAESFPPLEVHGDADADLCVVGWGSTWGAIVSAVGRVRAKGHKVAQIHLTHLKPLPNDLGDKLAGFDKVLVPEMNNGQLAFVLRGTYLVDARTLSKVMGQPFTAGEIAHAIEGMLDD